MDNKESTSGNSGLVCPCADLPLDKVSFPLILLFPSNESVSSSWKDGNSSFTKFPNKASNENSPY